MELQGKEQAPDGKNRTFCVEIITSMEKCKGNPSDVETEATSAMQCYFFPGSAAVNSSFGLQSTFFVCASPEYILCLCIFSSSGRLPQLLILALSASHVLTLSKH